jgi:hypothetical protein
MKDSRNVLDSEREYFEATHPLNTFTITIPRMAATENFHREVPMDACLPALYAA